MPSSDANQADPALQLRAEALQICQHAAWTPQCIGSGEFDAGLAEILAELRPLQKLRAVRVSQALIDCCRRHGFSTPLFEDLEARIWLFLGERERAEVRWKELLHHDDSRLRVKAEEVLLTLQRKAAAGELLATEVDQALDRADRDWLATLLLNALLDSQELPNIKQVLETAALQWPMPAEMPWDRNLSIHQLLLDLFEQQLQGWEAEDVG